FGGGFVENKYVANNRIGYGVYKDIVSQKTNSLLDEAPTVSGIELDKKFLKQFGYSMKMGGQRAAGQGVSYIYQDYLGNLTVFQSENCIPYFDDMTGDLISLIRFWDVANGNGYYTIIETYTEEGLTVYSTRGKFHVEKPLTPYKFKRTADLFDNTITGESMNLPITIFRNNSDYKSDMTPSVRAKIDIIDTVNSGFANNIEDFSELFWVIKNASGMDSTAFEDYVANINRSKKIIVGDGDDVDTKQIEIPTEARTKFVDLMKKELIFETGIIDTQAIAAGGDIRNIGIKLMTLKLRQRISDFEWEAYRAATDIINKHLQYIGKAGEFDIDFSEMLIGNDTEMIDNANKIRPDISRETYLELIKKAGYISDVKEELRRVEKENASIFSVIEPTEPNEPNEGE
ncbi:MAG: phage portal protein, partial [Candidatus Riflebacteria bacterium]|nr:phage portal protein [Candidatus Riflebacteria bacterium]